jgi:hypothetical protein
MRWSIVSGCFRGSNSDFTNYGDPSRFNPYGKPLIEEVEIVPVEG